MDALACWLALRDLPGVPRRELRRLLAQLGSPAAVLRAGGHSDRLAAARAELARGERLGLHSLTPDDPGFPPGLAAIPDPPLLVCMRGSIPERPAVAIVGSRRASASGRQTARAFARELAEAGVVVVSGLAYGIDAAAHEGALEGGGCTVAVLASGLDRPSPAGNRHLAERIAESGGAWLSEYPLGIPALPHHFPERNRLISGLARLTLVVEAREASGTLWTARHSLEQDRDLMAVPGPIDADLYRGSNQLLRDGAAPALEPADLLRALGLEAERPAAAVAEQGQAARVLGALCDGPQDADALARALGCGPAELASWLLDLELAGRIERRGNRIALRAGRAP